MARRNENLLESIAGLPWWFGIGGAVILYIISFFLTDMKAGVLPVGPAFSLGAKLFALVFAIGGVLSFIMALIKGKLFNSAQGFDSVKAMTWKEFELLVGEYYRRKGYSVIEAGGASPDGGIDLIANKSGEKLVIQCKHWKAYKIDVKIARELYGVMVDAAASGAVLITSGDFTQPAVDFVRDKPIELIDGPKLAKLIAEVKAPAQKPAVPAKSRATLIPTEPPPLTEEERNRKYMPPGMRMAPVAQERLVKDGDPVCPHCGVKLVLRSAHRGPTTGSKFWGT
ncbi:MAG: restriction endonuclease [Elusimicrobia bacterium]|nr:MAG: restriction endonuclease [Elusimicrobiota bacterium]KAF0155699.1 MAG: restriction endonuclease [Elusimicrobiota bacterium]